jgi:excisionase family DNA binding protein
LLQAAVASEAEQKPDCASGQGADGDGRGPRLLTVKEAAAILRVCTATVYAMVDRGELEHVRVSNAIRICVPVA